MFRIPPIARVVIGIVRLVPTLVTVAFAGWAVAAAIAGDPAIAAAAALMSGLALSVAVRSHQRGSAHTGGGQLAVSPAERGQEASRVDASVGLAAEADLGEWVQRGGEEASAEKKPNARHT